MTMVLRALVGVAGLLGVLVASQMCMAPEEAAAQLGVAATGPLDLDSIRADMGGLFGAGGVFALAASFKSSGGLLLAPVVLVGLALAGRLVAMAVNGFVSEMGPPLVIEVVLCPVFAAGWRLLPR